MAGSRENGPEVLSVSKLHAIGGSRVERSFMSLVYSLGLGLLLLGIRRRRKKRKKKKKKKETVSLPDDDGPR